MFSHFKKRVLLDVFDMCGFMVDYLPLKNKKDNGV